MSHFLRRIIIVAFWGVITVQVTLAQDDAVCPVLVREVLDTVSELCDGAGRNQACYGNLRLDAEFVSEVETNHFSEPGDIADVIHLTSLRLSQMNPDLGEWGVALMRLQANLPNTLPGQNVTMLLFGDVQIEPAYIPIELPLTITAGRPINVRRGPSTSEGVVTTLASQTVVMATGRNAAGDWLRIALPDEDGTGWIASFLGEVEGDLNVLNVVEATNDGYGPMQAFFLQTGIGDVQCAEAPQSGVLIQTPEGQGKINFTVNNVDIVLGSTAFLQAQADDFLYAYVIEGEAQVSAFETQKVVPAGAVVAVPVDANLNAAGPPNDPEPYAADDVMTLPVSALEQVIIIAEPADTEAIVESNSCTVVANEATNVRSGPGTNYPILSTMGANAERDPIGQADVDNGRWWKISSTAWINDSAVETSGNCDAVAIASIPTAPTSMSIGQQPDIRGTGARFNLWDCNGGVQRVISGSQIEIFISHGGGDHYASLEDARNANLGAWLSVNGTPYSVVRTGGFTDGIGHHYTVHFDVGALPDGTYYAVGQISSFPIPSCVVVVG